VDLSALAAWIDPGPEASLGALFLASFLAATVLPGGSELVLLGVAHLHPERIPAALALATLGNTLGGMSTYLLARLLPKPRELPHLATLRRWGSPALVLAWAPVVGDALCAAAGWLRLAWPPCLLWMGLGKFARYAVLLAIAA
jgi:membrane protein YqaA with SNARE-associated domain